MLPSTRTGHPACLFCSCGCALVLGLLLASARPAAALADPLPGHVQLDCHVLHLQINDYSSRWQVKLLASVTAAEEADLAGIEQSTLRLTAPGGKYLELLPHRSDTFGKRFKAANARLEYRAVEDTASRQQSNAPGGFFASPGPYGFSVTLLGKAYGGQFSFGEPLKLEALQPSNDGLAVPVRNFVMAEAKPLLIQTVPRSFGPVYYKEQDLTNFVYQLANMDDSLLSGSYHPPVESPRYVFQVQTGQGDGPLHLLDPSRYVEGAQPFLIRSDNTGTPLEFQPADLAGALTVLINFVRIDTAAPNAGFSGPQPAGDGWTGQLTVQERVVFALYKNEPPSKAALAVQADNVSAEAQALDASGAK
jgi:hypothetical protein